MKRIIIISALFAVTSVFPLGLGLIREVAAQSGASSKNSKRIVKSKSEEEKERKKKMSRNQAYWTPARIKAAQNGKTIVIPMEYHGESASLKDLEKKQRPMRPEDGPIFENEVEPLFEEPVRPAKKPLNLPEAFVQTETESQFAPITGASFDGPVAAGSAPPDTTMAVGPNHIVAWVNSHYIIYNKAGTALTGAINGNTLFTGVGGVCETTNRGDPILQYDRLADRWILSQFAFNTTGGVPSSPYLQCFAVSTTNDPTGTYFRYTVTFSPISPNGFNDYGKLGIWNDGYYTAYNIFGGSPAGGNTGAGLCVSDRTKMLAGDGTATTLCAPIAFYGGGASFLPADLDGLNLPSDTTRGGIFIRQSTAPALRYLRLLPNFAASTVTLTDGFGGATGSFVNLPLPTTTRACNGTGGTCVAQPGTANTLDTLGDRVMYRLAFRNRGGVESMVLTQSVDPDGAGVRSSAIRWYEIRNPLGNPSDTDTSKRPFLYQNGTYDPGGVGDRWMGSIATDKYGNMIVGYSKVDAPNALKPSIFVAGRSPCDTLSTLQSEISAHTGTGSQTGTLTRWGDYTTIQVDPADDTTFWFIGQYLLADGSFNWRTRIVSYRFPTTTATASGDFNTAGNWSNGVPSVTTGGIVPSGTTMTVNAPTTVCNLDVQAGGNVVMNSNLDVTGALTLGNSLNTSSSTLGLGCNATVSGAGGSIFVTGNVRKDFCSTGGFNFPIGSNGYTPVDVNVTTLTTNPSSLTATSLDATLTGFDPAQSLSRNWQLEESGDLTATLLFTYLAADVNGTEANYRVWRREASGVVTDMCGAPCVNTTNKTVGPVAGVTTFSRWTGSGPLAPTAANVSVSGRVITTNGNGIRNVRVTLTGQNGFARTVITNSFGFYHFDDVPSGETYVINASSKRYTFTPRTISVTDEMTDVDMVASP